MGGGLGAYNLIALAEPANLQGRLWGQNGHGDTDNISNIGMTGANVKTESVLFRGQNGFCLGH